MIIILDNDKNIYRNMKFESPSYVRIDVFLKVMEMRYSASHVRILEWVRADEEYWFFNSLNRSRSSRKSTERLKKSNRVRAAEKTRTSRHCSLHESRSSYLPSILSPSFHLIISITTVTHDVLLIHIRSEWYYPVYYPLRWCFLFVLTRIFSTVREVVIRSSLKMWEDLR